MAVLIMYNSRSPCNWNLRFELSPSAQTAMVVPTVPLEPSSVNKCWKEQADRSMMDVAGRVILSTACTVIRYETISLWTIINALGDFILY